MAEGGGKDKEYCQEDHTAYHGEEHSDWIHIEKFNYTLTDSATNYGEDALHIKIKSDTNLEVNDGHAAAVADSAYSTDTNLEVSDGHADSVASSNLLPTSTEKSTASLTSLPGSISKKATVLPDYVQPPTLFEVSSEGGTCSLKDLNVTIEFPQGAVPPGVKAYFRVAVCLGSGQSVYPAGAIPISAVFLLQMTEGVELLKDVKISLPHFLSDPAKVDRMGVMKAPHDESGLPTFIEQPCQVTPVDGQKIATFFVRHFCYLQLYVQAKSEEALEVRYCICPVLIPLPNFPRDTPFFMYFCLTYFDPTFLMALDLQCETVPRLKNHRVDKDRIIQFTASHSLRVSTVKFEVNKPQLDSGWQWDVSFTAPDMRLHPSEHNDNDFKYLANSFLYPPSYKLEVWGSGITNTKSDTVVVSFQNCSAPNRIAVPLTP